MSITHNSMAKCPVVHNSVLTCPVFNHEKNDEVISYFFDECPYGKRIRDQCPHGHKIATENKEEEENKEQSAYYEGFFKECPYGRRAAETCPYGHHILEEADLDVPPLIKSDDTKCPFASAAGVVQGECPVSGIKKMDGIAHEKAHRKCPIADKLPHGEKCPLSPNYKKNETPNQSA